MLHLAAFAASSLALFTPASLALLALPQGSCTGPDPSHPAYAQQIVIWNNHIEGKYQPRPNDSGALKTVLVKFHVVLKGAGTSCSDYPDPIELASMLTALSGAFAGANMQFSQLGTIDYILSDALHTVTCKAEYDTLLNTNNEPNAVDVYYVNFLSTADCPLCCSAQPPVSGAIAGIGTWTASPLQGIVMRNCGDELWSPCSEICVCPSDCDPYRTVTLIHEMGHYFDLLHPGGTEFGVACTGNANYNCSTCGDLVCDTPAEPLPSQYGISGCSATGLPPPACGALPYTPDISNYMNNKPETKPCRDHFTTQQLTRARATLLNLRPELL